jgi:HEAT repeat protein
MPYEAAMRTLGRKMKMEHGAITEIKGGPDDKPIITFSDGYVVEVPDHSGEVDISILTYGYPGTGPDCFHKFLNGAGFEISYDRIKNMRKGQVIASEVDTSGDAEAKISEAKNYQQEAQERRDELAATQSWMHSFYRYNDDYAAALKDEHFKVRARAAEELGKSGEAQSLSSLIPCIQDPSPVVREAIIRSLRKLKNTRAVKPLISTLQDEDAKIRGLAASALGDLGDSAALKPLIVVLEKDIPEVRAQAALGLGMLGNSKAVKPLIDALEDSDPEVQRQAAFALGRLESSKALKPLVATLHDEDAKVREAAARSLGWLGDQKAVQPLTDAGHNEDNSDVRKAITKSLSELD